MNEDETRAALIEIVALLGKLTVQVDTLRRGDVFVSGDIRTALLDVARRTDALRKRIEYGPVDA
jgi:hypothetical protein